MWKKFGIINVKFMTLLYSFSSSRNGKHFREESGEKGGRDVRCLFKENKLNMLNIEYQLDSQDETPQRLRFFLFQAKIFMSDCRLFFHLTKSSDEWKQQKATKQNLRFTDISTLCSIFHSIGIITQ